MRICSVTLQNTMAFVERTCNCKSSLDYFVVSHLSCRVAWVCQELCPLVGVPHLGLVELWEERPRGPLWGPEEGPVLPAQGDGPVSEFEGFWGTPTLCGGPERWKLQAIRAAKTWIWPLYEWNASEHRWTDQNSKRCLEETEPVWSSRGIYAKMIYSMWSPRFPFFLT